MTATPPPEFQALRQAAEALLLDVASAAAPVSGGGLPTPTAYRPEPPRASPVLSRLEACRAVATPQTIPVVDALLAAAPEIHWRRSYTRDDGFSAEDLERYGWFQLSSPEGPFVTDGYRITMGYWGAGFYYPRHWHAPAEVYVVLAGSAVFHSEGRAPRACGPGDTVWHEARQVHAADMTPGPLLALALWWGDDLLAKSTLVEEPRP